MLRSALERPLNKWRHEKADLAELAAACAFGLARNHAFVDGNKRISFMSLTVVKSGVRFSPSPADAAVITFAHAADETGEEGLTCWIRDEWPAS
jgi:death-on-curing protein